MNVGMCYLRTAGLLFLQQNQWEKHRGTLRFSWIQCVAVLRIFTGSFFLFVCFCFFFVFPRPTLTLNRLGLTVS